MLKGNWGPIATVGGYAHRTGTARHGTKRPVGVVKWGVWVPDWAERGQAVSVTSRYRDRPQVRYVVSVVRRSHGLALVTVSAVPPGEPMPEAASTPSAPFTAAREASRRNIRECEECEGPCRAGARLCDMCKEP